MNKRFAPAFGAASIALALGVTLGLSGCSSTDSMSSLEKDSMSMMAPDGAVSDAAIGMGSGIGLDESVSGSPTMERSTIETAYLSLTSSAPQDAALKAGELVAQAGGYVQDSSWSPANEYSPEIAYLTVRVPADSIDVVLTALGTLGTVDSLSRAQSDVTLQVTDLNTRIASLQSSLDDLRALQSQATNVSDLITVESAIAQRQAELDSLVAQQTYLNDQVGMSTIGVTISGAVGSTPTNQSFWDGLVAGWNSIAVAGAALIVGLGFAVPWILLLAVIGSVVFAIVVTLVRRARNTAAAAKPTAKPTAKPASKSAAKPAKSAPKK
jgi:TolA-binding protein